jgi:ATP-dependent Clp protease adaptor protein ClpS
MLDDAATREAIERAGGSLTRLSALVSAELLHVSDPSLWERLVSALVRSPVVEAFSFRRTLRAASRHIRRVSYPEVGVIDALVAVFQQRAAGVALRESGLSRFSLLRYHCHRLVASAQSDGEVPPAATCEVVIFNDHYTEMETVVRVLEEAFNMPAGQAFKTMLRVHTNGKAVIGSYPGDEAVQRLRLANQMAATKEAPLRVQLQAVQG